MNNSECIIQIKDINSTPFYRLRHKQHEPLLAYTKTEHKFQTIKLETCKPNRTNLKVCLWQLLQTDTNCTKFWGNIRHSCALREPSTVMHCDNKRTAYRGKPLGFAGKGWESSGESRIIFLPERSSICQYPPKISAINIKKQSRARLPLAHPVWYILKNTKTVRYILKTTVSTSTKKR